VGQIIGLSNTQNTFNVKGAGIVAVIDTGIDPSHPVLKNSLVPGYDFTRNLDGEGNETADVILSSTPTVSNATWVNQQSAANVDQSTAAVVDGNPGYSAFGHGTMVAGIVHLVAPGASLMPLKAFRADGTGYNSDIIRAIYFAVFHNANVLNMSFNLAGYSLEVKKAVDFAAFKGLISVAAAGNSGREILVYPAAFSSVMGVASTTNDDQRSSFSNYGNALVWVAAPGEGIVTTYPFATYAAGWGTSFSAPFVSGVAALMLDVESSCNEPESAQAMAHAKLLDQTLGYGRLDSYQAILAWRQFLKLQ
jgi:subtilisin family serine protease